MEIVSPLRESYQFGPFEASVLASWDLPASPLQNLSAQVGQTGKHYLWVVLFALKFEFLRMILRPSR